MDKAFILSEIKRTAAENEGQALGSSRFAADTGIKEWDWKGIHCVRWSDAIKEAGLEPNQFNRTHEKEKLFDCYASLVRELGRLPIDADYLIKRRKDRDFPNRSSFLRLGSKTELVRQVAEFFRQREGFQDVVELCETYLATNDKTPSDSNGTSDEETDFGFVYLMKSGRHYKIGHSKAAGRREYELAIQMPEKLTTIHTIRTDDPPGIEAYWHNRFAGKRKNGEWFELSAADIAAFKRRKFM